MTWSLALTVFKIVYGGTATFSMILAISQHCPCSSFVNSDIINIQAWYNKIGIQLAVMMNANSFLAIGRIINLLTRHIFERKMISNKIVK